jgi:hypothetical protein
VYELSIPWQDRFVVTRMISTIQAAKLQLSFQFRLN